MVVDRPSAWVQLPDQVNMHYRLYSEDLQHLPVLFLLSPTMLHLGFYSEYFNDEWLRENFTIVAFDTRHHGKTTAPLSASRDFYVEAADIAFAQAKLGLKPAHVFCVGPTATLIALHFALVFPSNCLSLCLSWVNDPCSMDPAGQPAIAISQAFATPKVYDELEGLAFEASTYFGDPSQLLDTKFLDDLIDHLVTRYPPTDCTSALDTNLCLAQRTPFKDELSLVQQPTLIIQADSSLYTISLAERLQKKLIGVPGCAELAQLPESAPSIAAVMPNYQEDIILDLTFFLERQLCKPELVSDQWLTSPLTALAKLASLLGDASIARRNPFSQESFCSMHQKQKDLRSRVLEQGNRTARTQARDLLSESGRAPRKFSQRTHALPHRQLKNAHSQVSLRTFRSVSVHSLSTGQTTCLEDVEIDSTYNCVARTESFTSLEASNDGEAQEKDTLSST